MKVGTREDLREIDSVTIEKYGISGLVLMENAGRAVSNAIFREYPNAEEIAIFCGGGNNGGDGFVTARHLLKRGKKVKTYITRNFNDYKGDAKTNLEILKRIGAPIIKLKRDFSNFVGCDLAVDAIFGTGLSKKVKTPYREIIEFINSLPCPRVSIDLPSGIDANKGSELGICVRADLTITFVVPKLGMITYPGLNCVGKLYIADISTPSFLEDPLRYELITFSKCRHILRPREENSHKGTYGHVAVLAGSVGKSGAAYLCSLGAARAGAGLVTAAIPQSINIIMEQKTTEIMTHPVKDTEKGTYGMVSLEDVREFLEGKTTIAIGPGISTDEDTEKFLFKLLDSITLPIVADADAVNLIARNKEILRKVNFPIILTPHPGEMARLCNVSSRDIQKDRIGYSEKIATEYGVYLILKGARTVIATPDGKVFINPTGNPGMASGGMGDVLTGMIAGFLSCGYSPEEASLLGVFSHGLAADLVAKDYGAFGFLASEIADKLPIAISKILETEKEPFFEIIH